MFEVMHIVGAQSVEFVAYQLKSVAKNWFEQWNDGRAKDTPHPSSAYFEIDLFGISFPEN